MVVTDRCLSTFISKFYSFEKLIVPTLGFEKIQINSLDRDIL